MVINRVVEKVHFLLSSYDLWVACLSMDLSDVHVSINMPRSLHRANFCIRTSLRGRSIPASISFIVCSIIFYIVAEEINNFLNFSLNQ